MKKNILIILLLLVFTLTGCTKEKEMYHDIEKVDTYLYKIDYDDYRKDINLETITSVEDYACSSVKNGNYYGRNFDFIYNDVPEFIVKVAANEDRHASIGVGMLAGIHKDDNLMDEYLEKLELLPNKMLDGINDAGVVCSINVVPKDDTAIIEGTNPNGEKLHTSFMVRYILDNANSADHAIELLKERNIYGDDGEHYNIHIMIADKDKTYVVEFIDNKLVAEEKLDNDQIMTNFYVNMDYLTENAAGVERYEILKEHYDEGNTMNGMWNLMQRVKYSNTYREDNNPVWYSEFLPQSAIKNKVYESNETKEMYESVLEEYWNAINNDIRVPANASYWRTTHNSIYDIKGRKLRITIQENYDKYYEYTI